MKLADAINDLLERITEILEASEYSDHMLERVYRMKEELVAPSVRALKARPQFAASAEALAALFSAVEEYVVCYPHEPERREERRLRVEGLKSRVRRELLPKSDREAEVEHLVDEIRKWQVKTTPRHERPPGLFDRRRRGGAAARPDRHAGRHQRHRAGRQGPAPVRGQGPAARQPRRARRADPHRRGPARHRRRRPPRAVRQPRIHPQGPEQSAGHRLRQGAPDLLRRRGAPALEPDARARRRTRIRSASCS